jgi:hypothetical protein
VSGSSGHVTPQRPHDSHAPVPLQSTRPSGQLHVPRKPPLHALFSGHEMKRSQSGSCRGSQFVRPQLSTGWHSPLRQALLAHELLHWPQWLGSLLVSMHSKPQRVRPFGQRHVPPTQVLASSMLWHWVWSLQHSRHVESQMRKSGLSQSWLQIPLLQRTVPPDRASQSLSSRQATQRSLSQKGWLDGH